MNILHYSLGLPPYRSGGLTKYSMDLMLCQVSCGENVYLLYPQMSIPEGFVKNKIEKANKYNNIFVYKLKNSASVPLLYGIKSPLSIINNEEMKIDRESLENFYNEVKPDILHIHTLMGLSLELIDYLKGKGVKIVYTSHDYYGLCFKVNFINQSGVLCENPNGENCAICNNNSPSDLFLRIRNSEFVLKHKKLFSSIANKGNIELNDMPEDYTSIKPTEKQIANYNALITYYLKIFKNIDKYHFNSSVSAAVYNKYINIENSIILPISHQGIFDNREIREINNECIHLGFIGNIAEYKGFPMLIKVLNTLKEEGIINWKLHVWGNDSINITNNQIIFEGKFKSTELNKVYMKIDLLIVPSIWKETFSLITLESISFGVPVLVSSNVGAKDIVNEYNPSFIITPTEEELHNKLQGILSNPLVLSEYNHSILLKNFEYDFLTHVRKIKQQLYLN